MKSETSGQKEQWVEMHRNLRARIPWEESGRGEAASGGTSLTELERETLLSALHCYFQPL